MIPRILVYCASRSVQGSDLRRLGEEKRYIKKNTVVQKFAYLPSRPHEPISTKFCIAGRLAYLITHDNFLAIGLGVLNLWGRILPFSYLQAVAVNTVPTLPRTACDVLNFVDIDRLLEISI